MNGADWVIVVVVLLSTIQAAHSGFFQEAFHLAGLVAGYLVAAWQYQRLAGWFEKYLKSPWLAESAGFLIIFWRGWRAALKMRDDFGRYLALGLTSSIVIQAFINISVVLDMGPTKGIPLPMISAGGSSLMSTLICLGMLLSVSEHSE